MDTLASAERIVAIQSLLISGSPVRGGSEALLREQRELWDRDHAGRSYEGIAYDVWALRRFPAQT